MQCIVTNLNNKKKKYSTHRQKKSGTYRQKKFC